MNENLNNYKTAYNTTFKFYDENQWYLAQYAKYMSNTILKNNSRSILSLGIGHQVVSDKLISLLDKQLAEYKIIEGSADIIANFQSKTNNTRVKLIHSYFENFDTNEKFDAIEMGFVLEHVDDPFLIVNKYKGFLKDNGIMFISVPNAKSLHRLIGNKAGLLDDVFSLSEQDYELGHKRYFDLDKISNLIEKTGLKIISKKGLMLKPITGQQIKQLNWDENIINALFEIGEDYPEIANCLYLEAAK